MTSALNDDYVADLLAGRGVEGARPWSPPDDPAGLFGDGVYYLGPGSPPLEVCVVPASARPKRDQIRELWRARHGRQASPLLLVCPFVVQGSVDAQICGPTEKDLAVAEVDFEQAIGLALGALSEPNSTAAVRYLRERAPSETEDFVGLRNQGMLASHTLRERVRARPDWADACERGKQLRGREGRDLVEALDFTIEPSNTPVSVLRAPDERARGVAVFLDRGEGYDSAGGRFGESSALSLAFTRADRDNIPFVVLTRGSEIRLYAANRYEGVGRKGQAETYVQADLALIADDEAGYVPLIFGADALQGGGSFEQILTWSRDYSADLSGRLRDRVYIEVVPLLAVAVAEQHSGDAPNEELDLDALYEETLVILFRLLFLAYAEDRDLLPYRSNAAYERAALKTIARQLAAQANEGQTYAGAQTHSLWSNVSDLFEAVDKGNTVWSVPAYNGGLFSPDPHISQAGGAIAHLHLTDERFGPPLTSLLTERGTDGIVGPIDFRSLSVRDFGTIYEGLLESSLSIAPSALTLDRDGNYVPATGAAEVVVAAGEIYHHNRSGARKASGSYFTKDFAVEHLLDHALAPALDDHIHRLTGLFSEEQVAAAAEAFFDFRCADLAMGSGHFLVAAVDHIEKRLAQFLDEHPIANVELELDRLKAAAATQLGDSATTYEIERRQLLRRQVARRCVYGVDRNQIAVELARLSLWVHTFVPGLPLSFLDHNLVQGDSLTGIGTVAEAVEHLAAQASGKRAKHGQTSVFEPLIVDWLEQAKEPLIRLGRASDATSAELHEVRAAADEAEERAAPVRKLFDLVCAIRRGEVAPLSDGVSTDDIFQHPQLAEAEDAGCELAALHFPAAFPEVFLRDNPGFDCVIGNPPWDKLQVEEHSFYALQYPGLRGLGQAAAEETLTRLRRERPDLVAAYKAETRLVQRTKLALAKGPYPGLTAGRPDLFKAFAWRFWDLIRSGGRVGVVLPRKALEASGTADWRRAVLEDGTFSDVTMLVNRGGWVFEDVHQQYTIGLIAIASTAAGTLPRSVALRGPFANLDAYQAGMERPPEIVAAHELLGWTDSATFPLVPTPDAMRVFLRIRTHPRLDEPAPRWEPRGLRELNATDDKHHFIFEPEEGAWPVYKGESFDIWQAETGTVYAWAKPKHITEVLETRRANQVRTRRSAFYGLTDWADDPDTLPCLHPRIAWRDTARATDRRTVRAALIPPRTVLVHQAYYLFWREGGPAQEAFALAILCSSPFDWYARQMVESHVTVEFMRSAPLPRVEEQDPRRQRAVEIAGRLAAVDDRYSDWAAAVGVETGEINEADRDEMVAELDALAASMYGLDEDDVRLIFETFHAGWDRSEELDRTLKYLGAI
jgi:hypothetical protein